MNEEHKQILAEIKEELPDALPEPVRYLTRDNQILLTSNYLHRNNILHEWEHAPAFSRVTIRCRGCEIDLYHYSFSDNSISRSVAFGWRELSEEHQKLGITLGDGVLENLETEGRNKWIVDQLNLRLTASGSNMDYGQKILNDKDLRKHIEKRFNVNELRNLCQDLGIDYEELGESTVSGMARELIRYCGRLHLETDLITRLNELRSDLDWNVYLEYSNLA